MASSEQTVNSTGQLTIADLQPAPGLTDQFDQTILRLCNTTLTDGVHNGLIGADANTKFCHQLRQASTADTVYLCDRQTLRVVATSSTKNESIKCTDTEAKHQSLTTMVADLWNCEAPLQLPKIRVHPESDKFSYTIIPLNDRSLLTVIVDSEAEESFIGNYYSQAVSALHDFYQAQQTDSNLRPQQRRMDCETQVLDSLQQSSRHLSTELTQHRLKILKQQLLDTTVSFDKCTVYNRTTEKLISGLRATLVNQSLLNQAPANKAQTNKAQADQTRTDKAQNLQGASDYLSIANNWNVDLISAVDVHILAQAIYQYKVLCEKQNIARVDQVQPLIITHHPQSLSNTTYIQTLCELLEKSVIHGSRLILETVTTDVEYNVHGTATNTQLQQLCNNFGVQIMRSGKPTRQSTTSRASEFSIADEFNVPGINSSYHPSGKARHNAKVKRA